MQVKETTIIQGMLIVAVFALILASIISKTVMFCFKVHYTHNQSTLNQQYNNTDVTGKDVLITGGNVTLYGNPATVTNKGGNVKIYQ